MGWPGRRADRADDMVVCDVEDGRGLIVVWVIVGEAVCIALFREDVGGPAVWSDHNRLVYGEYTMFVWCR